MLLFDLVCRLSLPGELRVAGVGRAHAPQVRRARAPAGRAPTSRSRSRAIAGRERNTVPEDGARPRGVRREGVPSAGPHCHWQKPPPVI